MTCELKPSLPVFGRTFSASFPGSSLGTHPPEADSAFPPGARAEQSFEDTGIPKLELGNEEQAKQVAHGEQKSLF
jgi:hypothetical protein